MYSGITPQVLKKSTQICTKPPIAFGRKASRSGFEPYSSSPTSTPIPFATSRRIARVITEMSALADAARDEAETLPVAGMAERAPVRRRMYMAPAALKHSIQRVPMS